jgi:protein-tyrosine-phosphatase
MSEGGNFRDRLSRQIAIDLHRYQCSFVSQENACRSLLAEACLNHLGKGRLKAYSCGEPARGAETPNSATFLALQTAAISSIGLTCKAWTMFTRNAAQRMDFVIGLDDETYGKLPAWPGQPVTACWDYPPITGKKKQVDSGLAAVQTLLSLRLRIELLLSLHASSKSPADLQHYLRDLSHVTGL